MSTQGYIDDAGKGEPLLMLQIFTFETLTIAIEREGQQETARGSQRESQQETARGSQTGKQRERERQ